MIIGITGSSGAGKSTVCEILKNEYNAKIIDADKIAKQLSKKGTEYLKEIVNKFEQEILLENRELNRQKLAQIIYKSQEKREMLNKCTFKYIREEIKEEITKQTLKPRKKEVKSIIAIDAPLLYEAELENICTFVIAVISDDIELQIQRIIKRDKITREHAVSRLKAQKPNEYYTSKSKYVIINNGNLEKVEEQVEKILDNR